MAPTHGSHPHRNLELKAKDSDPKRSLEICTDLGAEANGVLRQRDTYFKVPHGRLKLRREEGGAPRLIAYERPNRAGQKESRYWIVGVEDDQQLEVALSSSLGIMVEVTKVRRLFVSEGVRIHLDCVENLGSFIEFEAIAETGQADLTHHEPQLDELRQAFRIDDADLIGESYCDLALEAAEPQRPVEGGSARQEARRQRLLFALSKPERRAILRELAAGTELSPQECSKRIGIPTPNVSYHLRTLADWKAIVLVRVEPVRGSMKHYYRFAIEESWALEVLGLDSPSSS